MPFEARRTGRLCLLAALVAWPLQALPVLAETEPAAAPAASLDPATAGANPEAAATTANTEPQGQSQGQATTSTGTMPTEPALATTSPSGPAAAEAPPAPSPRTLTLDIDAALERLPAKATIDKRDRAGLVAAYAARKGTPVWVGPKGMTPEAHKLAAEIRKADDWGLKAAAFDLPRLDPARADGPDLAPDILADAEVRLSLAALKYARHARGGRVEPTALTKFIDRKPQAFEPRTVLEQIATAADPGEYLKSLHPRHAEFERLRRRYLASRGTSPAETQRLLANMEQWRWMPDDLGRFHVAVNVPEQLIRVVRDGQVIHTERVVVGKLDTQTPIFSDEMEQVIFHPFWGVPDSIKTLEVLPSLRGSGAVLAKHNLRLQLGGKDIDPKAIDWSKTDIRKFHVYQPPGSDNVLGVVKFRFPNKHDVYMHDTPSKSLFKSAVRTFSHGCMRVQNPVRLAELVLAEDRRMGPEKVQSLTLKDAPPNNQINLARKVPVHVTYFTIGVDEKGKVSTFKDIYGHEERILLGLDGKLHLIKPVPEPKGPASAEPVGNLAEIKTSEAEWARGVFSGGN